MFLLQRDSFYVKDASPHVLILKFNEPQMLLQNFVNEWKTLSFVVKAYLSKIQLTILPQKKFFFHFLPVNIGLQEQPIIIQPLFNHHQILRKSFLLFLTLTVYTPYRFGHLKLLNTSCELFVPFTPKILI